MTCDNFDLCQGCMDDLDVHHPQHRTFQTIQSGLGSGAGFPQNSDEVRSSSSGDTGRMVLARRIGSGSRGGNVISVIELQLLLSHMEQQMVSILFQQVCDKTSVSLSGLCLAQTRVRSHSILIVLIQIVSPFL